MKCQWIENLVEGMWVEESKQKIEDGIRLQLRVQITIYYDIALFSLDKNVRLVF